MVVALKCNIVYIQSSLFYSLIWESKSLLTTATHRAGAFHNKSPGHVTGGDEALRMALCESFP